MAETFDDEATATLRRLVGDPGATFRDGQLDAIRALVEDRRDQQAFDLSISALEAGLAHLALGLQLGSYGEVVR